MDHAPNGILLVDKAESWTSHDIVAKARRALGIRKVGHAGTLDPMATGLLLLGAGPATRLLTHLVGLDKTYTATIRLGQATVTDDREGEALERSEGEQHEVSRRIAALAADPARIREAAAGLTGAIEQTPSAVSAIKVDGRRAYDRVRAGEQVELKARPVTVHAFELGDPRLVSAEPPLPSTGSGNGREALLPSTGSGNRGVTGFPVAEPVEASGGRAASPAATSRHDVLDLEATIRCSSGTYVRALARDLGAALGVGGHLTALRRTEVGPFVVADAVSTESLADAGIDSTLALLNPAAVAAELFPVLGLSAQQEVDLGHGKRLEVDPQAHPDTKLAAAIAPGGRLVGLVEIKRGRTRVVTNFPVPAPVPAPAAETGTPTKTERNGER